MKIVKNTRLIERNHKLGRYLTFGALAILGVGLYISFAYPEQILLSFGALILGFMLSQVGIYYGNRFGRSPRPDEMITSALKGLDDRYVLYHYMTAAAHLLVGPAGIWVLLPYAQGGKIIIDEKTKHIKQKGGNVYLKVFAQESLGRPETEVKYALEDMKKYFAKKLEGVEIPPVNAAMIFYNPKVEIDAEKSEIPVLIPDKLKDFLRKTVKEKEMPLSTIQTIQKALPQEE